MACHVCGQPVDMTRTVFEDGSSEGERWSMLIDEAQWPSTEHGLIFHEECFERFRELRDLRRSEVGAR